MKIKEANLIELSVNCKADIVEGQSNKPYELEGVAQSPQKIEELL